MRHVLALEFSDSTLCEIWSNRLKTLKVHDRSQSALRRSNRRRMAHNKVHYGHQFQETEVKGERSNGERSVLIKDNTSMIDTLC